MLKYVAILALAYALTGCSATTSASTSSLLAPVRMLCTAYSPSPGSLTGEVYIQNDRPNPVLVDYTLNTFPRQKTIPAGAREVVATLASPHSCYGHGVVFIKYKDI